jgi:F5/8 type C domain-containing protein
MGRSSASVTAAIAALGLATLYACSLINLDELDPAPAASKSDDSSGQDAPDETTSDDSPDVASNVASEAGDDAIGPPGDDVVEDEASGDDEAANLSDGSASGSATGGSGTASGSASGAASGMSGSASGAASGSPTAMTGSASGAASDAGDGHKCGSTVLTPKAVVASSFQPAGAGNVALPANLAIDNDFTTRWGSALMTDPSWIYLDFGAPVFVSEVDILWQTACAVNYDIDISSDATHWTVMKTLTGNNVGIATPTTMGWNSPDVLRYTGLSGRGRYVRINGTARCLAMYGYSIWEARASGDADSNCTM